MCLSGYSTSTPPACSTKLAGENDAPWQTHTMPTSVFVYLYKNPVIVFPFGPFPVAETQGIWENTTFCWPINPLGFGGFPISGLVSLGTVLWGVVIDDVALSSDLDGCFETELSSILLENELHTWDFERFGLEVLGWRSSCDELRRSCEVVLNDGALGEGSCEWGWLEWLPASLLFPPETRA